MAGQHYCLRWNNYQSNMTSVFHQLLRNEAFVDVTLACNDSSLKAHKVVLSACSSYFQKLLLENPCKHPTIIMPQDVCFSDLKFIIEFVYRGEIDVSQAELQSLLKTADQLKIKGLCEVPEGKDGANYSTAEVTPLPILSRRSFTKLRRLSSAKRQRGPEILRRTLFKDCEHEHHQPPPMPPVAAAQPQPQPPYLGMTMDVSVPELSIRPTVADCRVPECVTVATSTEDDQMEMPIVVLETRPPPSLQLGNANGSTPVMGHHAGMSQSPHIVMEGTNHSSSNATDVDIPPEAQPPAPSATLVENLDIHECSDHDRRDLTVNHITRSHLANHEYHADCFQEHDVIQLTSDADGSSVSQRDSEDVKVKFETLRAMEQAETIDIDSHMSDRNVGEDEHTMHTMMITPELLGLIPSSSGQSDGSSDAGKGSSGLGPKTWTQEDMELALDALRNHNMSLTKASATYGIPSTTLWQRAHRMGIDTPKKEGPTKSWTEENLNSALEALRTGTISANKASKAYGIPSSTLYKIARREGIRLAAPFNAAPTTWTPDDLERALEAIRTGQTSVQRASTEFGIPTGTLYGRCKREGIELSRSNPTPWSEDAMGEALEAVRVGQMSINQAAIHYNLPYSSLYGRFKRGKYEAEGHQQGDETSQSPPSAAPQVMIVPYPQQHIAPPPQPPQLPLYQQHVPHSAS
ncbi:longitudinals lacking protein, isoforms H/M/V-like isoform X2 [Bacillus rossius redtenbacheri]|uniref:longitudinals lacking protein, isoforms H/M/V-like isoform X2 n=1 Tax=Bacillus rossius redtenbacheri TaxID=93214 RepID=UPI002FDD91BB